MYDHEERFAPFKRIIEYDNEQLRAELLPKYREMLTLFTERYHLAATDTRAFYQSFLEFVEIWNRWLAESLPAEVLVARAPRRERPSILRTSRIQDGGAPTRNRPGWGRPANKAMKRTGFARRLSPCRWADPKNEVCIVLQRRRRALKLKHFPKVWCECPVLWAPQLQKTAKSRRGPGARTCVVPVLRCSERQQTGEQ